VNVDRLVAMVNDIASFFESDPDPDRAAEQVTGHLRRFWEPRMCAEILRHARAGGEGLTPLALHGVLGLA
jgi:formate dehydrogenase subunit delta